MLSEVNSVESNTCCGFFFNKGVEVRGDCSFC